MAAECCHTQRSKSELLLAAFRLHAFTIMQTPMPRQPGVVRTPWSQRSPISLGARQVHLLICAAATFSQDDYNFLSIVAGCARCLLSYALNSVVIINGHLP